MLMIFSDVEMLDDRCADRAQLLHDDRVPLFPARREPGPRRSLNVSDLIGADSMVRKRQRGIHLDVRTVVLKEDGSAHTQGRQSTGQERFEQVVHTPGCAVPGAATGASTKADRKSTR